MVGWPSWRRGKFQQIDECYGQSRALSAGEGPNLSQCVSRPCWSRRRADGKDSLGHASDFRYAPMKCGRAGFCCQNACRCAVDLSFGQVSGSADSDGAARCSGSCGRTAVSPRSGRQADQRQHRSDAAAEARGLGKASARDQPGRDPLCVKKRGRQGQESSSSVGLDELTGTVAPPAKAQAAIATPRKPYKWKPFWAISKW